MAQEQPRTQGFCRKSPGYEVGARIELCWRKKILLWRISGVRITWNAPWIASRELETEQQIMDDVLLAIIEFQKVISDLEERFNNFEENQLHFVCATNGGNGGRGRPRLVIPQEQLEGLRSLGFSWTNIAKMLGVSERTIRRRRETFDMPSTGQAFSQIDDDEIDRKIQGILQTSPDSGERMIMGWFRGQGVTCATLAN